MTQTRYERGWEKVLEVYGEVGEQMAGTLKNLSPDLEKFTIEFAFGDVYSRPGLDSKSREIAIIAALTALRYDGPELASHIHGALNAGCTREEIVELMLQLTVYAGFPAAINGIKAADKVFEERNR